MAETNTIGLPPDLLVAVKLYTQTAHLSVEAVVQAALRFHLDADPDFNAIRGDHLDRALSLGLTPDEYVEKPVHEYRQEQRA